MSIDGLWYNGERSYDNSVEAVKGYEIFVGTG